MARGHRAEFGDFQTPLALARAVCRRLVADGLMPDVVVEPTCGDGAFLVAAAEVWPRCRRIGYEIDAGHRANARRADPAAEIRAGDAFEVDWATVFADAIAPGEALLILGNPPWVTSAGVGALGGRNRPARTNPGRLGGLDAVTGRSNFDVSEWLMLTWLTALHALRRPDGMHGTHGMAVDHDMADTHDMNGSGGMDGTHHIAMLLKTATIRRALSHHWQHGPALCEARQHAIDARRWFDAAVDAGLLVARPGGPPAYDCPTHPSLDAGPAGAFGWRDGTLVADAAAWDRARPVLGGGDRWRSGIKHDCARVFELRPADPGDPAAGWVDGFGERVDVEDHVIHPLMKSADVAHRRPPRRALLLPHTAAHGDPAALAEHAPRAWAYLQRHGAALDGRRSAVYRNRPRFSVFGVGPYSLAPYKVAVAALYDPVRFMAVGPVGGRPVVFDDTVYALACADADEARAIVEALESPLGRDAIAALSFPAAKRTITAAQLGRIDLARLRASIP